ncbi:MAG: phospho-sugar mutase [Sandaracinaceae bacterium]|nr:phospho-sugar mutase [Sandaracinaceae bacterium]
MTHAPSPTPKDHTAIRAATTWMEGDPDASTRAELGALTAAAADDAVAGEALRRRMDERLEFGTAGLRGLVGAGPGRLNRATVIRATHGLCEWLRARVPDAASRGVCIGFDARPTSRTLAHDVAAVVAGAGLVARVFEDFAPTPLVGFAILDQSAAAGVVVTASHNPPEYNGYKVFWEHGAQIVPPDDAGIAAAIDTAPPAVEVPRSDEGDARRDGRWLSLGDDVRARYARGVLRCLPDSAGSRALRIAYTPLHGVGMRTVLPILAQAGFDDVHVVASQAEPDGSFPTVRFPNPEEPGALAALIALCEDVGADVGVANDPDADRLAVVAADDQGVFEALSGNEIGCLLADYLLSHGDPTQARVVINTVVSSPLLGVIAHAHRASFAQTLTGHKWIHARAMEEEARGRTFVFGYEEALGYAVGSLVRDKDGISALLAFCDMAARAKAGGRSVLALRDDLLRRYGAYVSLQESWVLPGEAGRDEIRARVARAEALPLDTLGGVPVVARITGKDAVRRSRDGRTEALGWAASDLLVLELEGGQRAMLRPSGTEPKLKLYFDARAELSPSEPVKAARARARALATAIRDDLVARLGGAPESPVS